MAGANIATFAVDANSTHAICPAGGMAQSSTGCATSSGEARKTAISTPAFHPTDSLPPGSPSAGPAGDEVQAGRMSIDDARTAVHRSFLRLFGPSGL